MLPIGGPERILRIRVRRIVLRRSEELLRGPLLEFPHCGPALLGEGEELLGDFLFALMVTPDLSNDLRLPILHRLEGGHVHGGSHFEWGSGIAGCRSTTVDTSEQNSLSQNG